VGHVPTEEGEGAPAHVGWVGRGCGKGALAAATGRCEDADVAVGGEGIRARDRHVLVVGMPILAGGEGARDGAADALAHAGGRSARVAGASKVGARGLMKSFLSS
jgi:hypothetical protein